MERASSAAAGARIRATGCTSRLNGRSWSRITEVVSWNSGRAALSAGASAWAKGTRPWSAMALWLANACADPSVLVVCSSVGGSRVSAWESWASCEEMALKLVSEVRISEVS